MRELTEKEMNKVSGGARPEEFPRSGVDTALEQQGFPDESEGKIWNATKGIRNADVRTGGSPIVAGGRNTAGTTPNR